MTTDEQKTLLAGKMDRHAEQCSDCQNARFDEYVSACPVLRKMIDKMIHLMQKEVY